MTIDKLTGGSVDIASFRETSLVVNFWASWCVPCRQEAPVLNEAAVRYTRAVQFVGVDIQDSAAAARSYQAEFNSPYPVGPASQPSYLRWGVVAPPETFFISRAGIIVSRFVGPLNQRALEVNIQQLRP
jgi:cytochrome c biogenesis protein CcmG, thiol:disulfide interchange protein DsbE